MTLTLNELYKTECCKKQHKLKNQMLDGGTL